MIPLRDDIHSRSFPYLTLALIALNSLVFFGELSLLPVDRLRFVNTFGMVPARLHLQQPFLLFHDPFPLFTLASSAFIHHGWFHFLSNMWTLAVFGKNIEDRLGHGRFLGFYLLSALAANLLHALIYSQSQIPAIGASGAIAGIFGCYLLFFPGARILTLVPLFIVPWLIHVRAVVFLVFWFVSQLYSGLFSLHVPPGSNIGGVAWWAHIGGFLFGVVAARIFDSSPPPGLEPPPEISLGPG